jgi:uncharacterized protein YciI/heme-degrading monooxygenase HmoA
MPYFALLYDVVDDFVTRRGEYRAEHLRRVAEAYGRKELILAGALGDPADHALLIFHAADKSVAEAFARHDPYVVGGLVKQWRVRPWNVVTGNEAAAAPVPPARPREISRVWSARTTPEKWERYREHFRENVLPELRAISGYLGATLFVRNIGDQKEILVETFWRSLDAIHLFAGVDLETAVVAEVAAAILTEYDHHTRHYEIVLTDTAGAQ